MIDLRQMRQFVAVAEELSFRRAAERLNMSQPPLSQAVQRLEEEIGAKLFHRGKRKVTLTRTGEVMLDESHRVLAQADRAIAHVMDVGKGRLGRVEIGFVLTASYELLPAVTRRFRQSNSDIHLELHEMTSAQQIKALLDHQIDVAFLRPPLAEIEGLAMENIYHERLVAILPDDHPLASQDRVDLKALGMPLFVMVPSNWYTTFQTRLVRACQRAGLDPEIINDPVHLVSLVAAGMGVAIGPHAVTRLRLDGIVFKELDGLPENLMMELAIAWRESAVSRSTVSFVESSRKIAATLYQALADDRRDT
ncbi:MAG: LysR family transcriptional regulator [Alphaproteobacteria bacterium]|nr:LysR family transcriptional regulator [Alphaproteobacteria bacterium]